MARAVARGEADAGIVIDGAGIGSAIAANKVRGIRAAMCPDETIARYSREHNGANVLTLGRVAAGRAGRGHPHRRHLAGHGDARGPLHPAAGQGAPAGGALRARRLTSMLNPQDLQRLIDMITEEVLAAQGVRAARAAPVQLPRRRRSSAAPTGCAACSMPARRGSACMPPAARPAAWPALIDHTLLKPDATRADIEKLCREAAEFHFATVCVNPAWVALAAARLRGTPVGVCSVVGFPLGATTADVKQFETRRAIYDGATEIDMVINVGALKSGDLRTVERDIEAVVEPCRQCGVVSKVIIEAALLTDEEKVTASTLEQGGRRGLRQDLDRLRLGRRDGG